MKLIINGKETDTTSNTLAQLADEMQLPPKGVAVAVDGRIVTRGDWETYALEENQKIMIVRAACGG